MGRRKDEADDCNDINIVSVVNMGGVYIFTRLQYTSNDESRGI